MSENKNPIKPLPFPTMGRPEYVPGSNRAKMQGSGGEHMHLWLRESERELLYEILSKLFPDPDNQPDWYASHIPFVLMVAGGYAPSRYTVDRSHLKGIAPYGIQRSSICLFYNRYVVPRMEGKMSPRYLPPGCLSAEERKRRDFSIQTMLEWLPDDLQAGDSLTESNTKLAARLNDAGAREVDGRRFSPSSAGRFRGRHVLDAQGSPTDYDKFRPEEWKGLSVVQWVAEYYGSEETQPPDEEVASELAAEAAVDEELVKQAEAFTDEKPNEEARHMKKPKDPEIIDNSEIKSQAGAGTTKKKGKTMAKTVKVVKSLDEETERKIQVLMDLYPDPMAEKEPFTKEEISGKLREQGFRVGSEDMGGRWRSYWLHLPADYDKLYCKYAIPRLAENISHEVIIKKGIDSLQWILPHLKSLQTHGLVRTKSGELDWSEISKLLSGRKAISPSGCIFTPKLAKEFYHQYYVPHLKTTAAESTADAVIVEREGPSSAVSTHVKDREVDSKLVEDAVAFINEKANEAIYKYSIEIGNYLLEKFFDGDIAAASSRNPRKFTSYRELCKHPDLGPSPGALSVMLRVAAQEKLFEAKKLPLDKLSYSHKVELVTVFDDKTKVELFKEAVKKSLSVRQLQDRVREKKGLVPSTQLGQGSDGLVARFNFEALLKTKALSDPEAIKALPEKRRNELKERVEGAYAVLAQLLEEYGRLKDLFAELEK